MPEAWLDFLSGLVLAAVGYASTNVDNLLLLGSLLGVVDERRPVFVGFLAASAVVLALAGLFAALQAVLPAAALGWLGVLPIALGLRLLLRREDPQSVGTRSMSAGSIAVLLLGNSADTIAIMAPLYAESEAPVAVGLAIGFAAMVLAWTMLMARIARTATPNRRLARLAERLTPFVMIAIGVYVLADTTTDLV